MLPATMSLWHGLPVAAAAGASVAAWAAVHPAAQLFGPTLRRVQQPPDTKRIALTFDDGPNPAVTPKLLDLLERHGARATFFVIGRFVRACPELSREITARGHAIANHTYTHPILVWLSRARIRDELRRCDEAIASALDGVRGASAALWLRPPWGFRGPQLDAVVREQGLRGVVMWSRLMWDWWPQPAHRLIGRLRRVRPGEIVVFHDGDYRALGGDRHHLVAALEFWLPRWRDAGIEFVAIDAAAGCAEPVTRQGVEA